MLMEKEFKYDNIKVNGLVIDAKIMLRCPFFTHHLFQYCHLHPSTLNLCSSPLSHFASSAANTQWNAAGLRQRQSLEGSCGPNGTMNSPQVHKEF